jgi:hypothetical protein
MQKIKSEAANRLARWLSAIAVSRSQTVWSTKPTRSRIAAPSRSSRTGAAPRPAPGPSLPQVRAVAAVLADLPRTREQPRALLLPDNATFLDALFGCFYAGVCAVPAHIPIGSRLEQTLPRLVVIVADARPDVVLTTRQILPARELVPALAEIPCIAVDDLTLPDALPDALADAPALHRRDTRAGGRLAAWWRRFRRRPIPTIATKPR